MGQGQGSVTTNQKKEPAPPSGPPFAATSANNGVSVDGVSGKIVLGDDAGGILGNLLSGREIEFDGNSITLKDAVTGSSVLFGQAFGFGALIAGNPAGGYSQIRLSDTVGGGAMDITLATAIGRLTGAATFQIAVSIVAQNGAILHVVGSLSYAAFLQIFSAASTAGSDQDNAKFFTNEGAAALRTYVLESAVVTGNGAKRRTFYVQDADGITITAAAGDTIRLGTTVSTAGGTMTSKVIGSCVTLICINTTEWVAESYVGTWTAT